MAWVRIDDQVPRHHKILRAGPAASWLWLCGLAHCQSQLTDGFVAKEALELLGVGHGRALKRLSERLLLVRLWEPAEGGFLVHDYLDFNPSRAEVLRKRAEDAKRKGRNPSGIRMESERNPDGIQSLAHARARTPAPASHPIPSHPTDQNRGAGVTSPPASEPTNGARAVHATTGNSGPPVLAGQLPRDHLQHSACSDNHAWCVPTSVHYKLRNLLKPKHGGSLEQAGAALEAWYPTVWRSLPEDFVMSDAFKFWQPRFDAAFASVDPHAPKANGKPEPKRQAPTVEETNAKYFSGDRPA